MDMNNKIFAQKCGIETDEEMKVVCPVWYKMISVIHYIKQKF